jgi:hypothetical protein
MKCSPYGPALGSCGESCTKLVQQNNRPSPLHRKVNYKEPVQHGQFAVPKLVTNLFKGRLILDTSYVT